MSLYYVIDLGQVNPFHLIINIDSPLEGLDNFTVRFIPLDEYNNVIGDVVMPLVGTMYPVPLTATELSDLLARGANRFEIVASFLLAGVPTTIKLVYGDIIDCNSHIGVDYY